MKIEVFVYKIVLSFLFCLLISCVSVETDWEMDTYVGMTLTQVIELLGEPKSIGEKDIDVNYYPTPSEPPYFHFFSENELEETVAITIAYWLTEDKKYEIIVYLKNEDDKMIVFTSIKQKVRKNNPFAVYF